MKQNGFASGNLFRHEFHFDILTISPCATGSGFIKLSWKMWLAKHQQKPKTRKLFIWSL